MSATGTAPFFGIYDGTAANRPTISWDAAGGIGTPAAKKYQIMKLVLKGEAKIDRLPDSNGQIMGYNKRQMTRTLGVTMVVRGGAASGIVAAGSAAATLPIDLTKVVIANVIAASGASATNHINGDWIYETGGQISLGAEDEAELTFDLVQHFDDSGAAISVATLLAVVS